MPFVSIIVPIYKVESYIRECINSVLSQDFKDFELILVDDGSPDKCPSICDEYAQKDNRVKVIHKDNGGLSSARNAGIAVATGRYLMFIDGDDWWNPNVSVDDIFKRVQKKPNVEMFLFTYFEYVEGKGFFQRKEHRNLDKISTRNVEEYYQGLLDNGNIEVSACNKILKLEFIKSNQLFFKEGIKGEDNEWMIRVLRVLKRVHILNEPLYIYRTRRDSISHSIKKDNIFDLLSIIKGSLDFYQNSMANKNFQEKEFCFCSYLWFSALGLTSLLPKCDRREISCLFKQTNAVCKYSNSKKTRYCARIYNIFGFKITAWVLGCYIKMMNKKQLNRVKVNE